MTLPHLAWLCPSGLTGYWQTPPSSMKFWPGQAVDSRTARDSPCRPLPTPAFDPVSMQVALARLLPIG